MLVKKSITKSNMTILLYEQGKENYVDNNIEAKSSNGESIWTIDKLLVEYSRRKGITYREDTFFDIEELDEKTIKAIGFNNHLLIDIEDALIIKHINNR